MVEEECYFVESMEGINEDTPSIALFHMSSSLVHMSFSSFSNVEMCQLLTCQMLMFHNLML
jgi:hypothetical protein